LNKILVYRYRFSDAFGKEAPTTVAIRQLVKKFQETGSVEHKKGAGRPQSVTTEATIDKVMADLTSNPRISLRRYSRESGLSQGSLHRIKKTIKLKSYKIRVMQGLLPTDCQARINFCNQIQACIAIEGEAFVKSIWFSDECHVHLSGCINNRQNDRFLGFEPPTDFDQRPLHSPYVTVWCAMSAHGIIGPYFLEENNATVTVTGERYKALILERFVGDLLLFCEENNLSYESQWLQQDGAPPHISNDVRRWLQEHFPNRHISRLTAFPWPARSPDLTPPDFYLWGYLKSKCFQPVPHNLNELKNNIVDVIDNISKDVLKNVADHFIKRINICLERGGGHLEHVIKIK
jgi:hypothetical protein